MNWIENKTILTPTSGFLGTGYTHTINAYVGCQFAQAACGTFCYARWSPMARGRAWDFYGAKLKTRAAYREEYNRIKEPQDGRPRPLKIYMSSVTDPYLPSETTLGLTRGLLEEMVERPPDVLVIQTHNTLVRRDLDLIEQISSLCELWVSITVETDMERILGFPPHASSPAKRVDTLKLFRDAGIKCQAVVSPLLPLQDPIAFANRLGEACDRVILDHYLIGDGSKNGLRTKRTNFISLLESEGFSEWTRIEKLWEIRDVFVSTLGPERVLVSKDGFNAVGQ